MFRSKIFSVLQSIVNRNSHNIKYTNSFSTNIFRDNSTEASTKNSNEITFEATEGTSNGTSTESEPDKLYKKLEIEVRGNDPAVLKSYGEFAFTAAKHLEITTGRHIASRKAIHERLTLLKAVHVQKKHRVQYETRTYYRYLDFFHLTGSTADTFLEYIQRNLPEGVAMKVTKVELQILPETVQQATSQS